MGLLNLTADKVTQIFGFRKHKRLRGKFYTMLEPRRSPKTGHS